MTRVFQLTYSLCVCLYISRMRIFMYISVHFNVPLLACFTTTPSREDMVRTDTLDLDTYSIKSTGRNLCNLTGERALPKLSSANLADGCSPT